MSGEQQASPAPAPAPSPKPQVKTESSVEEAVNAVAEQVSKSKNPLLAVFVTLVTGGLVGGGGWFASSSIEKSVELIVKRLDKIEEALASREKADAAAVSRAQAERHEERIRDLEEKDRKRDRVVDRLSLEVEALKKAGAPK